MKNFAYWKSQYEANNLFNFNSDASGLLWLKIKSLTRVELLSEFISAEQMHLAKAKLNQQAESLFETLQSEDLANAHRRIDSFILKKHREQAAKYDEQKLVSELYKLRYYDWGGDYKNSLDKHLVDDFIKVYQSYDEISAKLDREIQRSVQGYVLCSWYNHWSSILIENIFKSHLIVLPAIGQIKKVDFFVNQIPFDLKVTYLPANFIEAKRKEYGLKPELTELKQSARKLNITFQTHKKSDDTYYEIVQKLKDRNTSESLSVLKSIADVRNRVLSEVMSNSKELIRNLYEQQGEMRFDAANRLFLILVDKSNNDESWKLRRNLDVLKPSIQSYLDGFDRKNPNDLLVEFSYGGKSYRCLADCIFVVKD